MLNDDSNFHRNRFFCLTVNTKPSIFIILILISVTGFLYGQSLNKTSSENVVNNTLDNKWGNKNNNLFYRSDDDSILYLNKDGILLKLTRNNNEERIFERVSFCENENHCNLHKFNKIIGEKNLLHKKSDNVTFTKITTGAIVTDKAHFSGCNWGDYDNDGYLDLFVACGGGGISYNNFLYRNNKDGTFTKITEGNIVSDGGSSDSGSWGDYDNDGDLDLFVANYSQNNFLYRNNGDGTFTRITTGAIANDGGNSIGCSWGDYDNDGYLDLFVANQWNNNFLYHNNKDGTFTKITEGIIVNDGGDSYSANWGDYDNDGYLDLFVANQNGNNNFLYHNNGDGTFKKITEGAIVNDAKGCSGASWGDYDNDGDLDLFVCNNSIYATKNNMLYQNNGNGTFTQITEGVIVNDGGDSWGSSWGDYDNDGDLDLFVTNRYYSESNFLYKNNGDATFTKITTGDIVNDKAYSYGCSWCDYDNDGDLDLFVANGGGYASETNFLYANNGNSNNWINIKLIGTISNTSGIGAKVRIKATINGKSIWQLNEISGQTSGSCGQNSLNAEFGLGDGTIVDSIKVEWPSGILQVLTNVEVNQFITIYEAEQQQPEEIPIYPLTNTIQIASDEFWLDINVGTESKPVNNLFGLAFVLHYNGTYTRVVSPYSNHVVPGDFLGDSTQVIFFSPELPGDSVNIGITRKAGNTNVTGSGTVARVKFYTLPDTPDSTRIHFTISSVTANDSAWNPIILTPGDLWVTIIRTKVIVWPGDTNNDGVVNQVDVLPIGLAWHLTGPTRATASTNWSGQSCELWMPERATYADATGNGMVDESDILPIGLNWGETHSLGKSRQVPIIISETKGRIYTILNFIGEASNENYVDIKVEDINDLFGIALELRYPQDKIQIISIQTGKCWSSDRLFYNYNDDSNGILKVALSQKLGQDGVNESVDKIARIFVKIKSNSLLNERIEFNFIDVVAVNSLGENIWLATENEIFHKNYTELPEDFCLPQNYPNPFNPATQINYSLPSTCQVKITIYNLLGQEIRKLVNEQQSAGRFTITWDGTNSNGELMSNGEYLLRMEAGTFSKVRKILFLR